MNTKKISLRVLVGLLVIVLLAAAYLFMQITKLKQDPQEVARQEAEQLVAVVGKLIILPQGELPTVATVSDPEVLKDQPFFAKAKKGDKVLLYATARKAYLFDPRANKILEVAPINLDNAGDTTGAPIQAPQPTQEEPDTEETTVEGETNQ